MFGFSYIENWIPLCTVKLIYMNEILYHHLIAPWIPLRTRPVLQKKDVWIFAARQVDCFERCALLADICIHAGVCDRRVCICRYFTIDDRCDCYNRHFRYAVLD